MLNRKTVIKLLKSFTSVLLVFSILISGHMSQAFALTQSDLDKVNKDLEELRKQQAALSSDFSSLNAKLDEASQKLAQIEVQINNKLQEIETINNEILILEDTIAKQYQDMSLRIRYSYETGSKGMLDILFDAGDISDLLNRAEYIIQMSQYDKNMMDSLNDNMTAMHLKQDSLNTELDTLVTLKTNAQTESDNIQNILASTKSKINSSAEDIKKMEELALAYEKKLEEQNASKPTIPDIVIDRGSGSVDNYTQTDVDMLAAIIECEAGNQPYEGLVAVASVVINRVKDPRFPNTIAGVLFSKGQFTPVASGRFAIVYSRGATDRCYKAALEALNGGINIDALYFHRYRPEENEKGTIIGDHIFMRSLH